MPFQKRILSTAGPRCPDVRRHKVHSPSMNSAESSVHAALIQQGWPTHLPVMPLTLKSITQSTVREILYTQYERLIHERLACIVLSESDSAVIWSVLQGHPRAAQKIGTGISLFVVSRSVNNAKQPCFFVRRTDGTVVDFGMKNRFRCVCKGNETAWREIMHRLTRSGDFARN